jgi:uncharacterized caspase-like protein
LKRRFIVLCSIQNGYDVGNVTLSNGSEQQNKMSKPKRLALLIGNNRYIPESEGGFPSLATPKQNVLDLEKELKQHGNFDDVERLTDPDHNQMRDRCIEFFSSDANKDDLLLLYFSGHGERLQSGEELYLAVKDTDKSTDTNLQITGINAHDIKKWMDTCHANSKILILDCCKSGYIGKGMSGQNDSEKLGNPFYTGRQGTIIFAAARQTETAWEGQIAGFEHSFFTHYLIKGLKEGLAKKEEYITVYDWFQYARQQVVERTNSLSERTNGKISPQNPKLFITNAEKPIIIARNPRYDSKEQEVKLPSLDDFKEEGSQRKKCLLWGSISGISLLLLGILIFVWSFIGGDLFRIDPFDPTSQPLDPVMGMLVGTFLTFIGIGIGGSVIYYCRFSMGKIVEKIRLNICLEEIKEVYKNRSMSKNIVEEYQYLRLLILRTFRKLSSGKNKRKLVISLYNMGFISYPDRVIDLSYADLANIDLHGCDLHGIDLRNTNLSQANLSEANLSESNLQGANLRGVLLKDSNLRDVILENAILDEVDLRDAIIDEDKLFLAISTQNMTWVDGSFRSGK